MVLVASVMFLGCTSKEPLPAFKTSDIMSNSAKKRIPIVRLHDSNTGSFFCTASVISNKYALTAAHCLIGIKDKKINIKLQNAGEVLTTAVVAKFNVTADVGLIMGDFSAFNSIAIVTNPKEQLDIINASKIVSCGYPWGGELYCTNAQPKEFYFFSWGATAQLFPGMSGGPVLSALTYQVIGVNYGMTQKGAILSPIVNIFDMLGIEVEAQ